MGTSKKGGELIDTHVGLITTHVDRIKLDGEERLIILRNKKLFIQFKVKKVVSEGFS